MAEHIAIGCLAGVLALSNAFAFNASAADSDLPWRAAQRTWTARLGERPSGGPWLLGNSVVYFLYSGRLVNLSTETGEMIWEAKLEGPSIHPPILDDGTLFVAANAKSIFGRAGQLVALDAATGKARWAVRMAAPASSALVISGDSVIVQAEREWAAFHRTTGKELWRARVNSEPHTLPPAVAGSIVLLPGYSGQLQAVDARTGIAKWKFQATLAPPSFPQGDAFAKDAAAATQTPEGREFFTRMTVPEVYLVGITMCRTLLNGATPDQLIGDMRYLAGEDAGRAMLSTARISICPAGTSIDQVVALARNAEPPGREGVARTPTVYGDRVFIRTINEDIFTTTIYVLDLRSGGVLFRSLSGTGGAPIGDDETVFFSAITDKHHHVDAFDIRSGKQLWTADLSKMHISNRSRLKLSERFIYIENARIDKTTGKVDWPMPFMYTRDFEEGEHTCSIISRRPPEPYFVAKFDFEDSKMLWAFRVENLKSPGFRVACGEGTAFFYEDWDDHPVFGVRLQ